MTAERRLLAVASGGGHWDELMAIRHAFDGFKVVYATTNPDVTYAGGEQIRILTDSNRWQFGQSVRTASEMLKLVRTFRPNVVVSTGAAPGAYALAFGKMFGARTIWVDGLAAAAELSMSGRMVRPFADLHLTQWEHLTQGPRTQYMGSIL